MANKIGDKRVYVRQDRGKGLKWYIGQIIGRNTFKRSNYNIEFTWSNAKRREWYEERFLLRMSNGTKIEAWASETYKEQTNDK